MDFSLNAAKKTYSKKAVLYVGVADQYFMFLINV